MARIALLSEDLINKIAAGEVVERPASVIKELVENSVDAGATSIRVTLNDGGLTRIRVSDDGHGMSREDARMALERHATSKLRDLEGLSKILTMGFRGEAVPAIASVSHFTLLTSEPGAELGTKLTVDGGGEPELEDAAASGGTVITVDELFFNTPARRKFLKKASTEQGHAEEALLRIALAHPEISFHAEADGRVILASPASEDLRDRISAALGREVHPHLIEVDERRLQLKVHGFIASPEFTLPTQKGLYTFVNGRFIRDRGVNHAIQRAYQESLPPGRQPVAVLFLEMDPRDVDVNVHPQKLEVRFADPRGVGEGVFSAVQRALRSSPWMKQQTLPDAPTLQGAHYAAAVEKFLARAQEGSITQVSTDAPLFPAAEDVAPSSTGFGQLRPTLNEAPPPGYFGSLRVIGTLARRFVLCEGAGGTLIVLDPHAAKERVLLSAWLQRLNKPEPSQPFLFATTVELHPVAAKLLGERLAALKRLGLDAEPFGGTAFALKSVPPELSRADFATLLESLAHVLPADANGSLVEAAKLLACHAAGDPRASPNDAELKPLLSELDRADFSVKPHHPQVVVSETLLLELERRAGQKN